MYKKLGPEEYNESQKKKSEKRDYEAEWEIYKAEQAQKERERIQTKVADAMWVPTTSHEYRIRRKDGSYSYRGY